MTRIKIHDLPKEMKIKQDELRLITGGISELSQFDNLILQMPIEQASQYLHAISSILRDVSDQEDAIISNIK